MFDLSRYADNSCFITENKSYSYIEIELLVESFCENVEQREALLLIKAQNNISTLIGYLAGLKLGLSTIMIDEKLSANVIKEYSPNYIWEEKDSSLRYIFEFEGYGLRINNIAKIKLHHELVLMLSTSGSTGSSKLVRLSKKNLLSNAKSIVKYLPIDDKQRAITNLPFSYSYGLSVINTHLLVGASMVITNHSIISKEFWELFKNQNVTSFNGVPYHYEILRKIGFLKMELASLEYLTQAGGKLNEKMLKLFGEWAEQKGIAFFTMYGQTEATARISYLEPSELLSKVNSIGKSIPDGKLYIEDNELIYQGDNVMMGYAQKIEDLEKPYEFDGVLKTGDLAYRDEEGYFYITGRKKRFIKIFGNRIGLDEVQNHLQNRGYDALCVGIDDKLIVATKELNQEVQLLKELTSYYKFHPTVIDIKYISEYPLSSSGKVEYKRLLEMCL